MMQRYLLIFLLSGMGAGALKAEKVLDGFDEEPFEQPVILPEKTRLSPVAAYMESLPPGIQYISVISSTISLTTLPFFVPS